MADFVIVEKKKVTGLQPAAMKEKDAMRYVGFNRIYFQEFVKSGLISFITLPGKTMRLYLREDLDAFLSSCKKSTMSTRESASSLKGIAR